MAKYTIAEKDDELVKIVDKVADELHLDTYIDFQVILSQKAKEVAKVVKANDFAEVVTKREDLVFVVLYADAFDLVDEKTKYMWIRTEMEKVSYDSEKGKVNIGCPCINVPIEIAEKYGNDAINAAKLAIYTISQIADQKKQEKEAKKNKKK